MIEPGHPQQIIREYVQMHGGDLVVLGTHGRGAVMEAFLGSTTKSILSTPPCDAFVVSGPPNLSQSLSGKLSLTWRPLRR